MTSAPTDDTTVRSAAALRSIVCGVDGSPADPVAVHHAAVLAGPDTELDLVSVVERPVSENARIMFTRARAQNGPEPCPRAGRRRRCEPATRS